jgi:two-component system NtrC family sensor kinase
VSIRRALSLTLTAVAVLGALGIAWLGSRDIREQVVREAQERVDRDLDVLSADLHRRLQAFGEDLLRRVGAASAGGRLGAEPAALLARLAAADLPLVNLCDPDGRPLAGARAAGRAPLDTDPVLRRAALGSPNFGLVRLDADRLRAEGGPALAAAVAVPAADGGPPGEALMLWAATPLRDADGRVAALCYGGRPLNRDAALVDELRDLVFGDASYRGRPLGTVTIFAGDLRVATNVKDPEGRRALGTRVSDEVHRHVLGEGRRWGDRARVLDDWYLSAYVPLLDPDREVLGMLYVGLLELPYSDLWHARLWQFVGMVALITAVAALAAFALVRALTMPLLRLGRAAAALGEGDHDHPIAAGRTFAEIEVLARSLETMRTAVVERDRRLQHQNEELRRSGAALEQANRNYMTMLGFVTHELKAPLGAIQMMSAVAEEQAGAELPVAVRHSLARIRVRSEELQDMVRDYLALSRAERGELLAEPRPTDLRTAVLDPALAGAEALLRGRGIRLEVAAPDQAPAVADPQLLRTALANLLSNAAKYGRAGGLARVELEGNAVQGWLLAVQNEGEGFSPDEAGQLFRRFTRLENPTTRASHGSGLGLFLVRRIAELHGGTATARAEPGVFARFEIRLPAARAAAPALSSSPPG